MTRPIPDTVTICKEGCRPVWAGSLPDCPGCGSEAVRVADLMDGRGEIDE